VLYLCCAVLCCAVLCCAVLCCTCAAVWRGIPVLCCAVPVLYLCCSCPVDNVEMEIVLPGDMTVMESHDIALALQHKIESLEDVERAFVHVRLRVDVDVLDVV
jgi:hypothetical protein